MGRLTARIARLEKTRYRARANGELAHLSDAELNAQMCQIGERLTAQLRNDGVSVADFEAQCGRPIKQNLATALRVELAAPTFDAARFLAVVNGCPAHLYEDEPDVP